MKTTYGLDFALDADGNCFVDGVFEGRDKMVYIPFHHKGVPVRGIGARAFADCPWIEGIFIPLAIKYIEREAFDGCVQLKSIYYGGNLYAWHRLKWDARGNIAISLARKYFYSEDPPKVPGRFWHIDEDSNPVIW